MNGADRLALSAKALVTKGAREDAGGPEKAGAQAGIKRGPNLRPGAARLVSDLFASDVVEAERLTPTLLGALERDADDPAPALGLAVCAVSMGRSEEARIFAAESLRRGGRHPRAYCVLGLCDLERGDRESAQSNLAVAARLARARPQFCNDLRTAQRLLLILHFGGPRRPAQTNQIEKEPDDHDYF